MHGLANEPYEALEWLAFLLVPGSTHFDRRGIMCRYTLFFPTISNVGHQTRLILESQSNWRNQTRMMHRIDIQYPMKLSHFQMKMSHFYQSLQPAILKISFDLKLKVGCQLLASFQGTVF